MIAQLVPYLLIVLIFSTHCNAIITSKQYKNLRHKVSVNSNINNDDIESLESLEGTLNILFQEREKKKMEMLAVDIAIKDLENELKNKLTSSDNQSKKPVITGTYDYGFSSKSTGSQYGGVISVKYITVPP